MTQVRGRQARLGARVCLGSVQFGQPYGISNRLGQPDPDGVRHILETASNRGVTLIDTAPAYGTVEALLGRLKASHEFGVITKTEKLEAHVAVSEIRDAITEGLTRSLDKLQRSFVDALMVHRAQDLIGEAGDIVFTTLAELKAEGLVKAVGTSVYAPEEAFAIADRYEIDLIQLPISVLDQRFEESGCLAQLRQKGVQIYGRSVFLQGLLLMAPEALPPQFSEAKGNLQRFRERARSLGLSPLEAALKYVLGVDGLDAIVLGVNSSKELNEILDIAEGQRQDPALWQDLAATSESVINPTKWTHLVG